MAGRYIHPTAGWFDRITNAPLSLTDAQFKALAEQPSSSKPVVKPVTKPKPKPTVKPTVKPKPAAVKPAASSPTTIKIPTSISDIAQQQAQAKYGPEIQAFGALTKQAQDTYTQNAHNARVGAQVVANAARQSQQDLAPLLTGAHQLAGMPVNPNVAESNLQADKLNLSDHAAMALLAQEGPRAAAGAAYREGNAARIRDQSVGNINTQVTSLLGQQGEYAAGQIASMLAADAKTKADADKIRKQYLHDFHMQTKKDQAAQAAATQAQTAAATLQTGLETSRENAAADRTNATNETTVSVANAKAVAKQQADDLKARQQKYRNQQKGIRQRKAQSNTYLGQINQVAAKIPWAERGGSGRINKRTGLEVKPLTDGTWPIKDSQGNKIVYAPAPGPTTQQANERLMKETGVTNPLFIHAARELAHNHGKLTAGTAGALKRRFQINVPAGMIVAPGNITRPGSSSAGALVRRP